MKELLNLAKIAALYAGAEILNHYKEFDVFKKPDNSPVTTADLAANEKIFEILSTTRIKICSEEKILKENERLKSEKFWLVDPLDGTREFIKKNGEFCVCIALIENGIPIFGVIFIPSLNELFYADKDGCFKEILNNNFEILNKLNLNKIQKNLNKTVFIGQDSRANLQNKLASTLNMKTQSIGSAIKFCRLCESGGVYLRLGPSSLWDIAAGDALVKFSGGEMISLDSKSQIPYNTKSLESPFFLALSKDMLGYKDRIFSFLNIENIKFRL